MTTLIPRPSEITESRPAPAAGRRRPRGQLAGAVVLYTTLGAAGLIFLMPFWLMISDSLKTPEEILRIPPTFIPEHPSLANFVYVLANSPFLTWFRNSLVVGIAVTATTLFTSSLAGYIFAKFTFPLKSVVFVVLLSAMMIPAPVLLLPSYLVMNFLGLLNSLWALIVGSMVSAFGIFLMRQFIEAIPSEMLEAARIDGVSEFGIYWRIIVPLSMPAMAALGIFTFLGSWNDYMWPLIVINDQDKMVLPLALTFFNSQHAQRTDLVMAAATMAVVPVFVVFLIFQKRIISAFVLTGIK